jgi:hypothetical protein
MFSKRLLLVPLLVILASPGVMPLAQTRRPAGGTLPQRLTDQEFWKLSTDLSEPNGFFRSENLVSNEHTFQYVIPALQATVRSGGVYLGVAPDQNFTYIIATQPRMAFIVDIRRGNLLQHLLYKAIIELSADRADFIARLFSKRRPQSVGPASSVAQLFDAFDREETTQDLYAENLHAIQEHLTKRHRFPLSEEDLEQLQTIYFSFFWEGPALRYTAGPPGGPFGRSMGFPSYEELMRQTDWNGRARGYLATEENFRFLKNFEERNLLVPVVGNFAGPKALRAVGRYIREHGAVVGAFYVSNVEQYLFQDGIFPEFARNVGTLPVDATSAFIRSVGVRYGYTGPYLGPDGRATALDRIQPFVKDFLAGNVRTYYDVNARSK